jgi:hypothetical protein
VTVTTLPPDWRWGDPRPDEPTAEFAPPADPWAGHDGLTAEMPTVEPEIRMARSNGRRPVFGRVYELFTDRPEDGEHPYVGQTTQTIEQRKRGHKSKRDVAKDPWKAHIIDGPRGHRLLETVYATGDPYADERELDRAEAFWIDKLRPTYNVVRPVRPRYGDPLPVRPQERSRPATRRTVRTSRRRVPWRVRVFLLFTLVLTTACAVALAHVDQPYPWLPWVLAPVAGVAFVWRGTLALLHAGRKLRAWR